MHPSQPTERLTIGKLGPLTPDQARGIAAAAALKVANGINPVTERREAHQKKQTDESMLLKNFAQAYLRLHVDARGLRSAKNIRRVIENDVCRYLGERSIAEITISIVERMMKALAKRSPTAARSALTELKALPNYARKSHKIDRVLIDVLQPTKPPERERVLTRRELRRFVEAVHDVGGRSVASLRQVAARPGIILGPRAAGRQRPPVMLRPFDKSAVAGAPGRT